MDHFPTWKEAHIAAQQRANETGLDVAIRKASKYDRPGFIVSFATRLFPLIFGRPYRTR